MSVVEVVLERPYLRRTVAARDMNAPIRFMKDEHINTREAFEWLQFVGDASWNGDRAALADALLDYLRRDFSQHCEDEQSLCELIADATDRSASAVQLHSVVDRSHVAFAGLLRQLSYCLEALAMREALPEGAPYGHLVRSFRVLGDLHMAWEEKRLLPFAAEFLGRDMLQYFGELMARRRGLQGPYRLRL